MTRHPAAGTSSHGTGDINLAAALMGLGIAPDAADPCKLILKDDGRNYVRFFIGPVSNCGKFEALKMLHFWSNDHEAPTNHPFAWIMDFITGRPQGCSTSSDWLDYAHDHLTAIGALPQSMPRRLDDIPAITKTAPEARASYVLAFVHCRAFCLDLARNARRQIMMSSADGVSHSIIDSSLPFSIRKELLARLQG